MRLGSTANKIDHRLIDVDAVMLVGAEPPQEGVTVAAATSATANRMRSGGIRLRAVPVRISRNGPARAELEMRQCQVPPVLPTCRNS